MKRTTILCVMSAIAVGVLVAPCAVLTSCSSKTHVAAPTPVDGATPEQACSALARIPCAEGQAPTCAAVYQRAIDARLIAPSRLGCVAACTTPEQVRACGEACQ